MEGKGSEKVIQIVNEITRESTAPCKKTLQKMVYLIEEKGHDLGFDYGIHFYGPYSADLDYTVQKLCMDGKLKMDLTKSGHIISIENDTSEEIETCDSEIKEVISEFVKDSPSELELLATTLYVARLEKGRDRIVECVIKIKGDKYSKAQITNAIDRLQGKMYFQTA